MKTSYWYISFLCYNYLLFWISYKITYLRKVKYLIFILVAILIFVFDTRIRAEQALSFLTGIFLSDNIYKIKEKLKNKKQLIILLTSIFSISLLTLGLKQLSFIRAYQGENLLFHSIELIHKFGFALFIIFALFYLPPSLKKLIYKNKFIVLCSTISLELYLVHFSLRWINNSESQIFNLFLFLVLSFIGAYIYYIFNKNIKNKHDKISIFLTDKKG